MKTLGGVQVGIRATGWDLPEPEALLLGRLMRSAEGGIPVRRLIAGGTSFVMKG